MTPVDARAHWNSIADDWLSWTSIPDQDPYGTECNLPALRDLVPSPAGLTLDIGCGEGRVSRLLRSDGHHVVGVDGSPRLARFAHDGDTPVAVCDGARLPVASGIADVVVSSMVLMDVPDLDGHVTELARVLRSGGTLVVAVTHPITLAGFPMRDEHETFAMGDYLHEQMHDWVSSRNDRSIAFKFWQRPVSTYLSALGRAGLGVVEAREPRPSDALVAKDPDASQWTRVPLFLHLRAVKLG